MNCVWDRFPFPSHLGARILCLQGLLWCVPYFHEPPTVVWLPALGIFNKHRNINARKCTWGLHKHCKRVCSERSLGGRSLATPVSGTCISSVPDLMLIQLSDILTPLAWRVVVVDVCVPVPCIPAPLAWFVVVDVSVPVPCIPAPLALFVIVVDVSILVPCILAPLAWFVMVVDVSILVPCIPAPLAWFVMVVDVCVPASCISASCVVCNCC